MSVFRPAARVTGPDGQRWEIYAFKIAVAPRDYFDPELDVPVGPHPAVAGFWLLDALAWAVLLIPRLVLRAFDAGVAAARALRSDEWTVEAVTWVPGREAYGWRTTSEYRGQVLAQVEGSLARGYVPQHLANATYLGRSRSAR